MEEKEPQTDNVVVLQRSSVLPKGKRSYACSCLAVEADFHTRQLECRNCHRIIDPFDYIWDLAMKEKRYISEVEHKRKELEEICKEVAELRRQRNYLKSAIKKAS